jgi:hypothetical protein
MEEPFLVDSCSLLSQVPVAEGFAEKFKPVPRTCNRGGKRQISSLDVLGEEYNTPIQSR